MYNLMKAEVFRIKHTPWLLLSMIGVSFLGVLFSIFSELLFGNYTSSSQGVSWGVFLSCISVGVAISSHFRNRTHYYEIMDGKSPNAIILSRLVVYMPLHIIKCFFQ